MVISQRTTFKGLYSYLVAIRSRSFIMDESLMIRDLCSLAHRYIFLLLFHHLSDVITDIISGESTSDIRDMS